MNKKAENHVGFLVHKTFNVTVPMPEDDDEWPGHKVNIGQEVKAYATFVDIDCRLPYIRAVFKE